MKLVTALLVRNEAAPDRYLRKVLTRCLSFSDDVVVLDDCSTDDTPAIAEAMGCVVYHRKPVSDPAWGKEAPARQELWDLACRHLEGDLNGWVLICDADQELIGDVRGLCQSVEVNTWSMVLLDMWSDTEYRTDGMWQAHNVPRPWLFAPNRVPEGWVAEWPKRGIHTGHCPANWPQVTGLAPPDDFHWIHWSYAKPEHRKAKAKAYKAQYGQMSAEEIQHAESILT